MVLAVDYVQVLMMIHRLQMLDGQQLVQKVKMNLQFGEILERMKHLIQWMHLIIDLVLPKLMAAFIEVDVEVLQLQLLQEGEVE